MTLLLLFGCSQCPCERVGLPEGPVTDEAGLVALLETTRAATFPDLEGVTIGVAAVEDLLFFRAWAELDTIDLDDGRSRTYTVQYDPVVLADPPKPKALAAVLVHEVAHVSDYVAMDSAALLDFAVWYATQDPATSDGLRDYERATDEQALERGCAEGLSAMREWVYAHTEGEVLAEKQRNYYQPAEIEAWVEQHGGC